MIHMYMYHVLGCRYDFARSDAKVIMITFHWHAHSVAEVCFTSDGELEHHSNPVPRLPDHSIAPYYAQGVKCYHHCHEHKNCQILRSRQLSSP